MFAAIRGSLTARGLWEFVKVDPGIVRGLAYYTGVVFEAFDLKHGLRAIAGGGRYDNLVSLLSDGGADMPACGFAMGDVVLGELIKETPVAQKAVEEWMKQAARARCLRRDRGRGAAQRGTGHPAAAARCRLARRLSARRAEDGETIPARGGRARPALP